MGLRPLALSHVEYTDGDVLGMLLAAASLLPIALVVATATLAAFRRELRLISLLSGLLLCEASAQLIKRTLMQPRPPSALSDRSPGMPSSHAQLMAFLAAYLTAFLYRDCTMQWRLTKHICVAALTAACGTVCAARVYLQYHSPDQVVAGLAIGAALGLAWLALTDHLLVPRFRTIQHSRLGKVCCRRAAANAALSWHFHSFRTGR